MPSRPSWQTASSILSLIVKTFALMERRTRRLSRHRTARYRPKSRCPETADMTVCGCPLSRSLLGLKRTCLVALHMSAYDPKRTSASALHMSAKKKFDVVKRETEIALALNPNYALAWNTRGNAEAYSGHPLAAIPYFERAMRLDPAFTQQYTHFLASAYLVAGQYKMTAASFRERIRLAPE